MKLLYIAAIDFYTKPNPSFHLMVTMLEDLLNAGIKVRFVGCKEDGLDKHIPEILESKAGFDYYLIQCPKVKKSNFIHRYLEGIRYAKVVGKYIKKNIHDCDVVFVQSSPTVLYTLYYARKYAAKKQIIYNVQDMFPGSSIASGVMPQKWMQQIFFLLQKIAYKKADVITAISEDMKYKLMEQGVSEEKIRVIVNWFDDSSVHEVAWERNRFVQKYNLDPTVFYVQYAGTMGYVFDYEMVLQVADRLKNYHDIVFQMIGEGSQKEVFVQSANKKELNNIVFLPLEPQEMVSDVYSACSVCFIPLKRGIIGNSVPSKVGLLMACKRAIVTSVDKDSDYYSMINKYAGIAASNDDPEAVVNAILKLRENRELCQTFGVRGYDYGHELYARSNNMKAYIELIRTCASYGKR